MTEDNAGPLEAKLRRLADFVQAILDNSGQLALALGALIGELKAAADIAAAMERCALPPSARGQHEPAGNVVPMLRAFSAPRVKPWLGDA
jgi:hypothetical protein